MISYDIIEYSIIWYNILQYSIIQHKFPHALNSTSGFGVRGARWEPLAFLVPCHFLEVGRVEYQKPRNYGSRVHAGFIYHQFLLYDGSAWIPKIT